jgi:hypothetical protein
MVGLQWEDTKMKVDFTKTVPKADARRMEDKGVIISIGDITCSLSDDEALDLANRIKKMFKSDAPSSFITTQQRLEQLKTEPVINKGGGFTKFED